MAEKSTGPEEEYVIPDGWEPQPLNPNFKNPGYCTFKYRRTTTNIIHIDWHYPEMLRQFQGRPSDIIVASFPKSGTTWLQKIVWRVTHHEEMTGRVASGTSLEWSFPMLEVQPPETLVKSESLNEMSDPRFI